jgi:cobalt/nickel transport protein
MKLIRIAVACSLLALLLWTGMLYAAEQWQGVDEAVVQKIAREHGREARKSLIDTGEGDMQLFVFLVAGAIGGFAAGYCWRALLDSRKKDQ